jgi:hypothetical protein
MSASAPPAKRVFQDLVGALKPTQGIPNTNPRRINTYIKCFRTNGFNHFRISVCEKAGGEGPSLLTKHPVKDAYPEQPTGARTPPGACPACLSRGAISASPAIAGAQHAESLLPCRLVFSRATLLPSCQTKTKAKPIPLSGWAC